MAINGEGALTTNGYATLPVLCGVLRRAVQVFMDLTREMLHDLDTMLVDAGMVRRPRWLRYSHAVQTQGHMETCWRIPRLARPPWAHTATWPHGICTASVLHLYCRRGACCMR